MSIQCVTFDLDDTLWECGSVLVQAERVFYDWVSRDYPRVVERFSMDLLVAHRREFFSSRPDLKHDVTRLRKAWLQQLAAECCYGGTLVEVGFEVFWKARNDVEVFAEARKILERLSQRYCVGAITNGNADVEQIGIGHWFDFVVTAATAGAAKPHPQIFLRALAEAGVGPECVVHVGDDAENDVDGAARVGMRAVWLNAAMKPWPGPRVPDAVIGSLVELEEILGVW